MVGSSWFQPTYRLAPYQDRIFAIAELAGYRVEFRQSEDGAVDALIFHQPNGTSVAPRAPCERLDGAVAARSP
jgi:hypothetical protein